MKLRHKWYDDPLIWDFYHRLFDKEYYEFERFEIASWKKDVYEGIDGSVVFINNVSDKIPTQIKTSSYNHLPSLKLSLTYINENGDDSGFGLYFNDDRAGNIDIFTFGFPFLGVDIIIDYWAMKDLWESSFDSWVEKYKRVGVGQNEYINIGLGNVLKDLHAQDWVFIEGLEAVSRSELEVSD